MLKEDSKATRYKQLHLGATTRFSSNFLIREPVSMFKEEITVVIGV